MARGWQLPVLNQPAEYLLGPMVDIKLISGREMAGMNGDAMVVLLEDREGGGCGQLDPTHARSLGCKSLSEITVLIDAG